MLAITKSKIWQLVLILFFFVLPFERIPTLEVAGFTLKISYILALVLIVLFIFSNPIKILKRSPLTTSDWLLLLFFGVSAISTIAYSFVTRSIIVLLLWAFMFILYLILSRVIISKEVVRKIEDAILIATLLICIFGLFQFVGDSLGLSQSITGLRIQYTKIVMAFPRIQSVALEPLYFANFLFIPLYISIKRYLNAKKNFGKYFWFISLIIALVVLTVSRGAFLALAITLAILFVYLFIQKRKDLSKKGGALILSTFIAIVFAFGLIYVFDGSSALKTFFGHSVVTNVSEDGSSYNRILSYRQSTDVLKKSVILGNGIASFGILTTPKENIAKSGYATVNNEYLEILAETGIIGLLLFTLFLVFYFREIIIASKQKEASARTSLFVLSLAVLAILIQYNFFSTLYIIYIWAYLALLKSASLTKGE